MMRKSFTAALLALMILLVSAVPASAFGDSFDFWHNILNDQVTLVDGENFMVYNIGYTCTCSSKRDWGLSLEADEVNNSTFGRGYVGTCTAGCTLSGQLTCMSGERLGVIIAAYDENQTELARSEEGNAENGAEIVEAELVVPDDAAYAAILLMGIPEATGFGGPGYFAMTVELIVDGKEDDTVIAAPLEEPEEPADNPEEPGIVTEEPVELTEEPAETVDEPAEDVSDGNDSIGDTLSELDKGALKSIILVGGSGLGVLIILISIIKGAKAKGAAKAAAAAAKAVSGGGQPAGRAKPEPSLSVDPKAPIEDSYVVTDPATGAQTLYVKDEDGNWVSSDGGSILNTDTLGDWQQQRADDRRWQDAANEGVKKPTRFEEIDKKQAEEEAQIHRDTYMEKVAISHGMDTSDMDAVFDKVAHDQARDEVFHDKWMEVAEHNDTGLKIAENLKTTADYSISALGAVTGPAGAAIKDVYTAGTTIGGDVAEAVAEGKDAWEIAETGAVAVTKASVGIIQNRAGGLGQKAAANIVGDAAVGGIDAYAKGKDVGQGIATGAGTGFLKTGVDAGNAMVSESVGGAGWSTDATNFSSAMNDVTSDFVKNQSSDALTKSFDKTFEELKPKK